MQQLSYNYKHTNTISYQIRAYFVTSFCSGGVFQELTAHTFRKPSSQVRKSSPRRSNEVDSSIRYAARTTLILSGNEEGKMKELLFPQVTKWFFHDCLFMPHRTNLHSFSSIISTSESFLQTQQCLKMNKIKGKKVLLISDDLPVRQLMK